MGKMKTLQQEFLTEQLEISLRPKIRRVVSVINSCLNEEQLFTAEEWLSDMPWSETEQMYLDLVLNLKRGQLGVYSVLTTR
jgi:hypothetical protein